MLRADPAGMGRASGTRSLQSALCIVEAMTALAMLARSPVSPALVFAGLQLVLGLTWAVYALFLPQLVVAAGLPRTLVRSL